MRTVLLWLLICAAAWAQNPATAVFPGTVATDQDLLVASNSAKTTLAADLAINGMSVEVINATKFTPPMILTLEAEKIKVCSKLNNVFTVCPGGRAWGGTTAAAHASGVNVVNYVEAPAWNQTNAELKAVESALGVNMANVVSPSALGSWGGSANITTLGTISSGTVPWGNVGSKPSAFTPSSHASSHAQGAGDALSGTLAVSITGSAGSAATAGSATTAATAGALSQDPAPCAANQYVIDIAANGGLTCAQPSKAQVGLGSVENTAISTWPGSANITTLGTISSGTVPWTHVGSKPSALANITGNGFIRAADLGCGASWNAVACDADSSGTIDYADTAGAATNATTVAGLGLPSTTTNNEPNKIVRTEGNGYVNFGWINTVSGDNGTAAISRVYASNDAYISYYTLAHFASQAANAIGHDASWVWQDNYIALPLSAVQWGVFTPRAANATITSVVCWADTGDAVIQLRRSDQGDMINGNLACNGTATVNLNGYNSIPVGYYVGMWAVSGTAKSIRAGITYTTAY